MPWLRALFGDVTAFQSLMYMLSLEGCIACGFIHSNSRYAELFAASVGVSAQIADANFNIRYAARDAAPIPKACMESAVRAPILADGGLFVHVLPISGGYAVWTEDVSALLAVKEEAESLAEELKERNELLRYEYKREAKHRTVEEQNRLYDLLQAASQRQIDRIAVLISEYQSLSASDAGQAQTLLAEIAVLCSYIKRRGHLALLADRDYKVAVSELERAFSESLQTLKLLHVCSALYVDEDIDMLSGKTAAAVFDFYELVIEADLEHLQSIQVSLADTGALRLSLHVRCKADLSALGSRADVRYTAEADGEQHLVCFPEGGASA